MDQPEDKTWIVAIWPEDDTRPIGTAIVIDEYRVLTAKHVVRDRASVALRFAFSPGTETRKGTVVAQSEEDDVVVLKLDRPIPTTVRPATLRAPSGASMRGKAWWAHGFPHSKAGNDADGTVGTDAGFGMLRLDTGSRYPIERGFSGAGVWAEDHEAVVAMVCWELSDTRPDGERGDAFALSIEKIVAALPEEKLGLLTTWELSDASADSLLQWGWALTTDQQLGLHWSPRARGVTVGSERGYRFKGRRRAVQEVADFLVAAGDERRPQVVTGAPGRGKSAVLARVITTADDSIRRQLPTDDDGAMAEIGSVSCAVHAKGKTALEVAQEVARAVSADPNGELSEVMLAVADALDRQPERRFTLIIDALDEATSPNEARRIAGSVVRRLATEGRSVRVVVASRRYDAAGPLLYSLGASAEIDLDDSGYTEYEDVVEFAVACLQLQGAERPGNPYDDEGVARLLATRIAHIADGNFLIAGLLARRHGQVDIVAASPSSLRDVTTVETALLDYLSVLPDESSLTATELLTPLAFAEAPGLTVELWAAALQALTGRRVDHTRLEAFAHGSAANFLVDEASGTDGPVFRLYHQALNDELLKAQALTSSRRADEMKLYGAWAKIGRSSEWREAPAYLLQSLSRHAQLAGLIDELLEDGGFLLNSDLRRLKSTAWFATTARGLSIAQVLRAAPGAVSAMGDERADHLAVAAVLSGVKRFPTKSVAFDIPFASVRPSGALTTFTEHTDWVRAVGAVEVGERTYVTSASDDGTVKVWDPATGDILTTFTEHTSSVLAVGAVEIGERTYVTSASDDCTVKVWDPATGDTLTTFTEHTDSVLAVGAVEIGERTYVTSASDDGTVKVWDPATGTTRFSVPMNQPLTSISRLQPDEIVVGLDAGLLVVHFLLEKDVPTGGLAAARPPDSSRRRRR